MHDLVCELKEKGIDVVMGRVSANLREDLERHGIADALGAGKIFKTLHEALEAAGVDVTSHAASTPLGAA